VQELAQFIIPSSRILRICRVKFNVAFNGGGLIGSRRAHQMILASRLCRAADGVLFRIAIGGATGHKTFARDLG